MHNILSEKYNEPTTSANHKERENAHLGKELKKVKAALFVWEAKFKKVESKAEYYEDKSTSIKLFTTVKVHAEMLKEYIEGKISTWDLEAAFSAWEKMKALYLDSEKEKDRLVVKPAGPSGSDPSGPRDGASGSKAVE